MAKSKEALQAWLDGLEKQGKLPEEKLAAIRAALTPDDLPSEAVEYVGSSVLRQEDYSRQIAQAKAKEKEAAEFQQALSEWKAQAEAEYLAMQKAKATAEAEVARVKALAASYDVPESELGKVATVEDPTRPVVPQSTPQIDVSDFIKKQDAQQAMMDAIRVQNKLLSIAAKHQTYFGKPLDDDTLVDRAIASGRTVEQEWEETYKVADKRAELAAAQQEAHDQRIREEERAKLLSELKLPETRPGAPTSPVLNQDFAKATPAETVSDRMTGIQAALESFSKGTYRQSQS